MQDPEHAEMLVEAQERAEKQGDKTLGGPAMNSWSAEVEAITALTDRVNALIYITKAANGAKGEKPPKPMPRPRTLLASIKARKRQERHENLAARLLRRKS